MDPELVLCAFLKIWHELPALMREAWNELQPEIEAILRELQRSHGVERARLIRDLAKVFNPHTKARQRLRETIGKLPDKTKSGNDGASREPMPPWPEMVEVLGERLDGASRRYTDVTSPERLTVGCPGAVTVALSRFPASDSVASEEISVKLHEPVEVHLQSRSNGLEVIDHAVCSIYPDDRPCGFLVRGTRPGRGELLLDFWQGGRFIHSLGWAIEVREEETAGELRRLAPASFPMRTGAPPDLSIRVVRRWERGQERLFFILKSPNDTAPFPHVKREGPVLPAPAELRGQLNDKVQALLTQNRAAPDAGRLQKDLEKIGHWLYRTFFSEEVMDAYRDFRSVRTIQIISNESWIPWEWIKPYDDRDLDAVIDDDFLCLRFEMTRWLAMSTGPPHQIHVRRAAFIETDVLPDTAERTFFRQLASERPEVEILTDLRGQRDLEELLDAGGLGLWHFAGPPPLAPDDVHGGRQTQLARDRPFVFLNADTSASDDSAWKESEDWSAAFVGRGRCGAFLVCARPAGGRFGGELASRFYRGLALGRTFAQALREARQALRSREPLDITWISYSLYADPNGKLSWGAPP